MDDSNKQQSASNNQDPVDSVGQDDLVSQSSLSGNQVTALVDQSQQPQVPPVVPPPASIPHKEAEPIPTHFSLDHMSPSEHKIELSEDLKEAGVENPTNTEHPELSEEAKKAGVERSKESVGMDPLVPIKVQLPPYKREEVLPHSKNGSVTDAARWFYTFLLRQIDKVKQQNLSEK